MPLNSTQTTALPVQTPIAVARPPAPTVTTDIRLIEDTPLPIERLLVLIPDCDVDESALAKAVWSRAVSNRLPIVLVGICATINQEPRARRRLVTLAALIRDSEVKVETQIYPGLNWVESLTLQLRRGDMVVCQAEQTVRSRWLKARPLATVLLEKIEPPVVVLSGFYPEISPEPSEPATGRVLSAVPFIIFVLSSLLQLLLCRIAEGTALTLLLLISVIIEYGLIGLWSLYYNR